jgi:NAD-dependent DNA ligase
MATWYSRIVSGEITSCPACKSPLKRDEDIETMYVCTNEECCWTDELADFEEMGHYTPPPSWRRRT